MSAIFSDSDFSGLHPDVIRQLEFLGFKQPTHIQRMAIEPVSAGKDVLLQSATGSGKTIAFAAPLLHRLKTLEQSATRGEGTYAVILSPTKELCLQTFAVMTKLARMMPNLIVGHVAGGDNPQKEKARIRKGLTILCATPGRLVYHLQATQSFKTDKIQTLILDEADRLLDMGFERQIKEAHAKLVKENGWKCQTVQPSLRKSKNSQIGVCGRMPRIWTRPRLCRSRQKKKGQQSFPRHRPLVDSPYLFD
jgi:ATP-dependent RNA helicase DDX31/DBP7